METTRKNDDNDGYSSIKPSPSQATAATTQISSSENDLSLVNTEPRKGATENNANDGLVIDIEDAIDRLGMGMFQFQIIVATGLCFASDAMEVLLLGFLGVILQSEWGLSESQTDSIVSVVFLGAMFGTLVLSPLGDKLGRRIIFAITASTIGLFGTLTAFCSTYPQILMVRFMVGVGVGGLTVPYDALGEFMPTARRGKNMLSTSFFWTTGTSLVPLFAWMTLGNNSAENGISDESTEGGSWRTFVMLCSLPSVISTLLGILFVPESPRWLLTRGQHEKSLKILRQAAAKNGKDPFLAFPEGVRLVDYNSSTARIYANNETSRSVSIDIDNDNERDNYGDSAVNRIEQENRTYEDGQQKQNFHTDDKVNKCAEFEVTPTSDRCCQICLNPRWRKMSFLLGGQWYGLAFMYYGAIMATSIVFSDIHNNEDDNDSDNGNSFDFDYGAIFISSSAEAVGLTLAILMVDRAGRVSTQIWAYSLGGFCLLLLGFLYVKGDVINGVDQEEVVSERRKLIFFAFLARMFIMAATSVTWLHTAELLPTRFRATGHGLASAMGRIGGVTCPFIVSRDNSLRTIGFVMFSVSVATSLFIKCLPETTGKALGNFDVSLKEQAQVQSGLPLSSGRQISKDNNSVSLSFTGDTSNNMTDKSFHGDDPTDERVDERIICSFEII